MHIIVATKQAHAQSPSLSLSLSLSRCSDALILSGDVAPAEVVGIDWSRERYEADREALMKMEPPYFRDGGTCGHCGDSDDLPDRSWVGFLS